MNALIELVLLGPPRGKGRPQFSKRGHAYTDEKTRTYEDTLGAVANRYMLQNGLAMLKGPLSLELDAWMPIPKSWSKKLKAAAVAGEKLPTTKPDWDNFKMLDALNLVVWHDDAQIVKATVTKRYSLRPRLVVRIGPVEHLEPDSPYGG